MQTPVEQAKQFLHAVYARRHLFIIVAASVALIVVFSSFFRTKVYVAKSTVFIERNVINSLMKGITVSPSMDDRIRVLRYYMLSRDMVTKTLKQMDMDADERYVEADKFEGLLVQCQKQTVIRVRGKDLFFVSMTSPDPYFAKEYINTLVNIYVEENLAAKREESYGANRFLTEQVTFYKQKLDEVDGRIIDFRKETGIYSNVDQESLMTQIADDEDTLKWVKGEKAETYAMIKTIKQQLEMLKDSTALDYNADFDDFGLDSGEDYRIEPLQSKIDELLLFYNEKYPLVVKLREQIEELQKRQQESPPTAIVMAELENYNPFENPIYVDLKMRMNSTQADFNAIAVREKDLLTEIKNNQALLRDFPEDKKTLNDLERERAMQAAIYEKLLERVGVSEVSKQMEVADKATTFRIVDPAIQPTNPIGTKRILIMLLGLLGGLAAGLGAVYVAEHVDNTIKGPLPLRALGVTVLAEIPFIWSDVEAKLMQKKDRAALAFAAVCSIMIGIMLLHDLLGMSFIDRIITNLGT